MHKQEETRPTVPVISAILLVALTISLAGFVAFLATGMTPVAGQAPSAAVTTDVAPDETTGHPTASISLTALDGADYILIKPESPTDYAHATAEVSESGVTYRDTGENLGCTPGTCIEWTRDGDGGWNEFAMAPPENNGTLTVDSEFAALNYSHSGALLYAVDAEGEEYILACDGHRDGTISTPSDHTGPDVECADRGSDYTFEDSYEVDADAEVTSVRLLTDVHSVNESWNSVAQLTEVTATNPTTGETDGLCIECHATLAADDEVLPTAPADEGPTAISLSAIGSEATLTWLAPGERITVIAVEDGKKTVATTVDVPE